MEISGQHVLTALVGAVPAPVAQATGAAYLSILSSIYEIGPKIAHYIQKPTSAPVMMGSN